MAKMRSLSPTIQQRRNKMKKNFKKNNKNNKTSHSKGLFPDNSDAYFFGLNTTKEWNYDGCNSCNHECGDIFEGYYDCEEKFETNLNILLGLKERILKNEGELDLKIQMLRWGIELGLTLIFLEKDLSKKDICFISFLKEKYPTLSPGEALEWMKLVYQEKKLVDELFQNDIEIAKLKTQNRTLLFQYIKDKKIFFI